jgi:hypothetical protein
VVDSINSTGSVTSTQRAQTAAQNSALRNNAVVLNAIVQTQQKASGTSKVALAVPQTSNSGNASKVKLPRGSLIDVLA